MGDLTLADFWGYQPKQWKMRNFDHGVSCIIVNTEKGSQAFRGIRKDIVWEERTLQEALRANKSLQKPYEKPKKSEDLWEDFLAGLSVEELSEKYILNKYAYPSFYPLRKLKRQYSYLLKKFFLNRQVGK